MSPSRHQDPWPLPASILVVEHSRFNRSWLINSLSRKGYRCLQAGCGMETARILREHHEGVLGHGVASAMTVRPFKAVVIPYLGSHDSLAAVLSLLNQNLLGHPPKTCSEHPSRAATLLGTKTLHWSLARHPYPLPQAQDGQMMPLEQYSPLLGVFSNDQPLLEYFDRRSRLTDVERLVLYAYGLLDAPNAQGKPMGSKRLEQLLNSTAPRRLASWPKNRPLGWSGAMIAIYSMTLPRSSWISE